jgi:hypothetical protein
VVFALLTTRAHLPTPLLRFQPPHLASRQAQLRPRTNRLCMRLPGHHIRMRTPLPMCLPKGLVTVISIRSPITLNQPAQGIRVRMLTHTMARHMGSIILRTAHLPIMVVEVVMAVAGEEGDADHVLLVNIQSTTAHAGDKYTYLTTNYISFTTFQSQGVFPPTS